MTTFNPEAPGRGPNPHHMHTMYWWERVGDLPIVGRFDGVVLGIRKGADTLQVGLRAGGYVKVRYENLVRAIPVTECPECGAMTLLKHDKTTWGCQQCPFFETMGEG